MTTTTKPFSLIVACTQNGGIGKDNGIPWHVPQDMKHFYRVTTGIAATSVTSVTSMNAVIMGRKTWESMQQKRLKNRINVVISGSQTLTGEYAKDHDIILAKSLQDALDKLREIGDVVVGDIFVIGGASVYQDALCHPMCTTAHVTWIRGHYDCDTFFPVEELARTFVKDGTVTCLCVEETSVYSIMKYERLAM